MYSRKLASHSTSLSPSLTIFLPPAPTVKFFSSTGSMTGSMYSSRFSNRKGKPYWMASSSCLRKSESLNVLTLPSSALPSRALIHDTACICGSMHSGQRLARIVRMPFCTDSSSEGRPSDAHCVVSMSDVSSCSRRKGCVSGTPRSSTSCIHMPYTISCRYSYVKVPV